MAETQSKLQRMLDYETVRANSVHEMMNKLLNDALENQLRRELPASLNAQKEAILSDWLRPPKHSFLHENARETRILGTSEWFSQSEEFREWMRSNCSALWLCGEPGVGKTILFSSMVDYLDGPAGDICLAYFYFSFRIEDQDPDKFIRSLIEQLARRSAKLPKPLQTLYQTQCAGGQRQPPNEALWDVFREMMEEWQHCYLLFDGVDELPEEKRTDIISAILKIMDWNLPQTHLLVSSRKDFGLEESFAILGQTLDLDLTLSQRAIEHDISTYIAATIKSQPSLSELSPDMQSQIYEMAAMNGSGNFYRIELMLSHIAQFGGRSLHTNLPLHLSALYAQALGSIEDVNILTAFNLFQWMMYGRRPFAVDELGAMLAVAFEKDTGEDFTTTDPKDLLILGGEAVAICGNLLVTTTRVERTDGQIITQAVLTHQSIVHYLQRNLASFQSSLWPDMGPHRGHCFIAHVCIRYLMQLGRDPRTSLDLSTLPLAKYAAENWTFHLSKADTLDGLPRDLSNLALDLLNNDTYRQKILLIHNPDWSLQSWSSTGLMEVFSQVTPLYYAAATGLATLSKDFLTDGMLVNEHGGRYHTPLHAAAINGHIPVVKMILEQLKSGNEHSRSSSECSPHIQQGSSKIVSACREAQKVSKCTDQSSVWDISQIKVGRDLSDPGSLPHNDRILLYALGESDRESGRYGSPLQLAAFAGHQDIVQLLLDHGTEVDVGTLHATAYQGNCHLFEHLWNHAKSNLTSDDYIDERRRTLLHKAAMNGQLNMLDLLLRKYNVKTDNKDDQESTALDIAAERHHFECFNLLLRYGAEPNTENALFSSRAIITAFENCMKVDIEEYELDKAYREIRGAQADVTRLKRKIEPASNESIYPYIIQKHYRFNGLEQDVVDRALECLWREQYILQHTSHPNIVKFLGFQQHSDFEDEAILYMEYGGDDLHEYTRSTGVPSANRLKSRPPPKALSLIDTWSILVDLSSALAFCHHGVARMHSSYVSKAPWPSIVHRDIKPSNVLRQRLDSGIWVTKLCDLGLAKATHEVKTRQSRGIGTETTLAPEIKLKREHPTIKSDIYSLGATIQMMNREGDDPVLTDLINQCLLGKPSDRPSSLRILQTSRHRLGQLQQAEAWDVPLITGYAHISDYLLQVFVEILNRLFRCFKLLHQRKREAWAMSLQNLRGDANRADWHEWQLDKSLILAMLMREWDRSRKLIATTDHSPSCEQWWDCLGLKPIHVAICDKKTDLLDAIIKAGIDHVSATISEGDSALDLARMNKADDIVEMLLI